VSAALLAWWSGAFGSWYAFSSGTLVRATPLILAGLAIAIAFRAGVFNIGGEGQLLVGAAAAAAVGSIAGDSLGPLVLVLALVAGSLAGAGWAGIAALLRARFRVLEVISTILLNFLATYAIGYLVRGPLQEHLRIYPQSESIPEAARLPLLGAGTRLHAGFLLAVAAALITWYVMRETASGFRLRVAGANPRAAQSAGRIDVLRTTTVAFLVSGALAGLAGASELTGVTYALYENLSPGYGFTAIAVALLARLHPLGVIATGILFGALESGAAAMQRDAGVPSVLATAVEAIAILVVVAVGRVRFSGAPSSVVRTETAGARNAV
jgi:general nucleoside transport system permease protein